MVIGSVMGIFCCELGLLRQGWTGLATETAESLLSLIIVTQQAHSIWNGQGRAHTSPTLSIWLELFTGSTFLLLGYIRAALFQSSDSFVSRRSYGIPALILKVETTL